MDVQLVLSTLADTSYAMKDIKLDRLTNDCVLVSATVKAFSWALICLD